MTPWTVGEGIGYPLQYSWASLVAQLVKICPQCGRPGFNPRVGEIPWRKERLSTPVFWPGEFHRLYSPWDCKESGMTEQLVAQCKVSACQHRSTVSIPNLRRSPWKRKWQPTSVFLPGGPHGQSAWCAPVHRVGKSQKQLSG